MCVCVCISVCVRVWYLRVLVCGEMKVRGDSRSLLAHGQQVSFGARTVGRFGTRTVVSLGVRTEGLVWRARTLTNSPVIAVCVRHNVDHNRKAHMMSVRGRRGEGKAEGKAEAEVGQRRRGGGGGGTRRRRRKRYFGEEEEYEEEEAMAVNKLDADRHRVTSG